MSVGAILQQCPWTNGMASCNSSVAIAIFPTHNTAADDEPLKETHASGAFGKIEKMTIHLKTRLYWPSAPSGSLSSQSFKVVVPSYAGRPADASGALASGGLIPTNCATAR